MSAYADLIRDFADRTRKNLEVIEKLASTHLGEKPHEGVFKVTQLVNSLLGLLVFPQQEWFDCLPDTPLKDSKWKDLNILVWATQARQDVQGSGDLPAKLDFPLQCGVLRR